MDTTDKIYSRLRESDVRERIESLGEERITKSENDAGIGIIQGISGLARETNKPKIRIKRRI